MRRGAVEQLQAVAERGHGVVAGQGRYLRVDRRDLDRDDLDLGRLQALQVQQQAVPGFLLAEDRLAEEVDVHPHPLGVPCAEVWQQRRRLGRQDDVGRLPAHLLLDRVDGDCRCAGAELLQGPQEHLLQRIEVLRDALRLDDVNELAQGPPRRRGAEGLVGQEGQGGLVLGMLQHAVQFGLLPPLGRRLQGHDAVLQAGGQQQGLLDGGRLGAWGSGRNWARSNSRELGRCMEVRT